MRKYFLLQCICWKIRSDDHNCQYKHRNQGSDKLIYLSCEDYTEHNNTFHMDFVNYSSKFVFDVFLCSLHPTLLNLVEIFQASLLISYQLLTEGCRDSVKFLWTEYQYSKTLLPRHLAWCENRLLLKGLASMKNRLGQEWQKLQGQL